MIEALCAVAVFALNDRKFISLSLAVSFCFVLLQLSLPDFGPEGWNAMGQGPSSANSLEPPALTDSSENAFETPFQKGILFAFKDYSIL